MMRKKGFSVAEMVVALSIVTFLAYIMFPQLKAIKPNTELSMFRKAYYNAERIVQEMINDENLYPIPLSGNDFYFANTESVNYQGKTYVGDEKFARLFASKLGVNDSITCSTNTCVFTSPDGIVWTLPKTSFSTESSQTISVDVNGDKKPNCAYGGGDTCIEPDRFNIKVYKKGVVAPGGCMEKEYLERKDTSRNAHLETFNKGAAQVTFTDSEELMIQNNFYNHQMVTGQNTMFRFR